MNFLISVIIPAYNRANYIVKTVQSVLEQTYQNVEIIVIDDGSTDDTKEKLTQFSNSNRFHYHYQNNQGRSTARNKGIDLSKGEFLLFLDSDDFLAPAALEVLSKVANISAESGVIAGRIEFVDESEKALNIKIPNQITETIMEEFLYPTVIRNLYFPMGSYIVKREIALLVKGFEPSLEPCEDYDFCLKANLHCKASCVNEIVVYIRRHGENTAEDRLLRSVIKVAQKHFDYLNQISGRFETHILKKMKADLNLKIADANYSLGENFKAFKKYSRVVTISPKLIFDTFIIRQMLATAIAKSTKDKIKMRFRKQFNS